MRIWLPYEANHYGLEDFQDQILVVNESTGYPKNIFDVEFIVPPMFGLKDELRENIRQMSSLKVVQSQSAGVEDLIALVPKDVLLCNASDAHHTSTAEMAMALLLASMRGIDSHVKKYDWNVRMQKIWQSLADKKVLIIGYGSIGKAIERRLAGFECEVIKVATTAREDVHAISELPDLLPQADVVIIALPHTPSTTGLADAKFFASMKSGATFLNMSRGPIAITDDLYEAVKNGRINAALDVTDPEPLPADHPLFTCENVLIVPHVAGRSTALQPRLIALIHDQVTKYMTGQPLRNVIRGEY